MDLVLFFSLVLLVQLGGAQTGCTSGDVQLIEEQDPENRIVGFVQYCYDSEWRTICRRNNDWYTQESTVACRQLGYSDQGAESGQRNDGSATNNFVTINCNGRERSLQECIITESAGCDNHARAVCQPANCVNEDVRLTGGTTNREGRVEVCLDGRWGTVDSSTSQREKIANKICVDNGFPSEGVVIVDFFAPGSGPVYSCTQTNHISCSPSMNNHALDLGIMCLSQQEINQITDAACQECTVPPTPEATTCPSPTVSPCPNTTVSVCPSIRMSSSPLVITSIQPSMTIQSRDCSTDAYLSSSTRQAMMTSIPAGNCNSTTTTAAVSGFTQDGVTTIALGALVGVLVALLVAIVIGWICTCVFLRRKTSEQREPSVDMMEPTLETSTEERELDNPIYSDATETRLMDNPLYAEAEQPKRDETALPQLQDNPIYEGADDDALIDNPIYGGGVDSTINYSSSGPAQESMADLTVNIDSFQIGEGTSHHGLVVEPMYADVHPVMRESSNVATANVSGGETTSVVDRHKVEYARLNTHEKTVV